MGTLDGCFGWQRLVYCGAEVEFCELMTTVLKAYSFIGQLLLIKLVILLFSLDLCAACGTWMTNIPNAI